MQFKLYISFPWLCNHRHFNNKLWTFSANPHALLLPLPNMISSLMPEINKLNQIYIGNERINRGVVYNDCRYNSKLAKNKIEYNRYAKKKKKTKSDD